MELFDTHAHLDYPDYDADREEVLERAKANDVKYILNIGIDVASSRQSVRLARSNEHLYAAVGIHPSELETFGEHELKALHMLAAEEKVVGLGEIGLDYYRNHFSKEKQQEAFRLQLDLAGRLGLPVIIHDREAHEDVLKIIQEEDVLETGGIMHCFSGDWAMAKKCMDNNLFIAIGGAVTFKNSPELKEVAKKIPRDRLLLETDCPFLSPEPRRGKRNEPGNVRLVAEYLAGLRDTPVEDLAYWTTLNALRLFGIN